MAQLSNDNCDECHKEETEVVNDCGTGRPDLFILLRTQLPGEKDGSVGFIQAKTVKTCF